MKIVCATNWASTTYLQERLFINGWTVAACLPSRSIEETLKAIAAESPDLVITEAVLSTALRPLSYSGHMLSNAWRSRYASVPAWVLTYDEWMANNISTLLRPATEADWFEFINKIESVAASKTAVLEV